MFDYLKWGHTFDSEHIECVRCDNGILIFVADKLIDTRSVYHRILDGYDALEKTSILKEIRIYTPEEFEVYKFVTGMEQFTFVNLESIKIEPADDDNVTEIKLRMKYDRGQYSRPEERMLKYTLESALKIALEKRDVFKYTRLRIRVTLM